MRDAVSQGLGHGAFEKPRNVFQGCAGFWNQAKGNLVHMRHVIPNLQFGLGSCGFGALDKRTTALPAQPFPCRAARAFRRRTAQSAGRADGPV